MFKRISGIKLQTLCFIIFLLAVSNLSLLADTTFTFLYTNDVHAWLTPEEKSKYGNDLGGVARIYEYFTSVKKNNPNTLLLNAGDVFQGTPFYGFFKGEACLKALEAAGYAYTTLGNHEFDNGLPNLMAQLRKVKLRLLCCNVFSKETGRLVFPPYKLVNMDGKTIAIIGSIGDSAWRSVGINMKKPVFAKKQIESVKALADSLRPAVDMVVLLSHGGVNSDKELAAEVNSVDLIIGGHSHTFLFDPIFVKNKEKSEMSNSLDGTVIVQSGKHGLFVGKIDVTLNESNQIATYSSHLEKMDKKYEAKADNPVVKAISGYKKQLDAKMDKVIGFADFDLTFSRENKNLCFSSAGNFATTAMNEGIGSDICITNAGSVRSSIYSGKVTIRHIYTMLPFDNNMYIVKLKGKDIQIMLNEMCSYYGKGPWFQCAGVSCTFDIKNKIAQNISINGKPLDLEKVYSVSTSSFVAEGNLKGDTLFKNALEKKDTGIFMRDAALKYILKVKNLGAFKKNGIELTNK